MTRERDEAPRALDADALALFAGRGGKRDPGARRSVSRTR